MWKEISEDLGFGWEAFEFIMSFFVLPILIFVGLIFLFIRVFKKTFLFASKRSNRWYVFVQLILTLTFIAVWELRVQTGIIVVNQVVFNCIIITGYFSTALFYPLVNNKHIKSWLKYPLLVFSLALWLPLMLIPNPVTMNLFLIEGSKSILGIETKLLLDNEKYRVKQMESIPTSGGQYYYQVVEKHRLYEDVIKNFHGYPENAEMEIEKYKKN